MKRFDFGVWLLVFWLATCGGFVSAAQSMKLSDSPSGATLLSQDQAGLIMKVEVGTLNFVPVSTREGAFVLATVDGFTKSQKIGEPNVPVLNRLISIPYGCDLQVEVLESQVQEISLADLGLTDPLMPVQPPLSKSQDPSTVPFEYNREVYAGTGYYSLPLAQTEIEGVMRALRLGMISIAPIEYNPAAKTLRVYKQLTVRVTFLHPDWAITRDMWRRYYSPYFLPVYNAVLNYRGQESMLLDDMTRYPVKYVIVSDRMFEAQLAPFIQWKTKMGFTVITAYTDIIGHSNTQIKTYLHNLYDSGTPEDPAPSFVLLVGDAQQIAPFQFSGHISDLSFCEYTGDNIPEVYYGRFSAQNPGQLQPQIDKTLEYEQYLMPDPSYLGRVTMIAGVDATYAPLYGNGQINYGTSLYFNAAHGIFSNTWLYPASNGPVEGAIIQTVNDGVSFINYTAHGSHTDWSDPTFTVANVNSLTNAHKYTVAVGNCCLTCTFGTDYGTPCLGEVWLQAANKGAVGYIGASNSSYWDEDYWWGVGYGPVNVNPTYEQNGLGAYDGMFHDHGEPVTEYYVTNEALNFRGLLAVQESNSSRKAYYWQIYHLMGDPSVMVYLGIPTTNSIIHDGTILLTATSFTVQAAPGSYVGISMNGVLHGAAHVDQSGTIDVPLTPFGAPGTADIVVTAQNKIPYIATVQVISPSGPYVIYDSSAVNDIGGNNNGVIDAGEPIILGVRLKNVGPDTARSVVATLSVADSFVTITDGAETYGTIPGNNGTVDRPNAFTFQVSSRTPDTHIIRFQLTVSGTALDIWISNVPLTVHAPSLAYLSVQINDSGGNNNGILDPGETAQLVATISNSGTGQASSIAGVLSETDPYVTVSDPNGTFGNIAPNGGTGNNVGDPFVVSASSSCPMGHAMAFGLALAGGLGYGTNVNIPIIVGDREVVFYDDFSSNQGWTGLGGSGEWTIGPAVGGTGNDGSGGPDPSVDHSPSTDNKVLGNDLTSGTGGDYNVNLTQTYWVTSPIIDCSNYTGVQMNYYHWLGVESSTYDHAYLQVNNGTSWVQLYQNPSSSLDEQAWVEQTYDLAAYADNNANFQMRFGMGLTDGSVQYCGWNIDDIELKGYNQGTAGNPQLSFSLASIADSLAQGDSIIYTFKIYNTGDAALRVRFTSPDSWLIFSGAQNEIAPNDSVIFPVTVLSASLGPGMHNGALNYQSNDTDNPSGTIPISIFIYMPNIVIAQQSVGDTISTNQQSSVPLIINNTGQGRLFYNISCEVSGMLAGFRHRLQEAPAAADIVEPIGHRPADPGKSSAEEPYYPPVIAGHGGPDAFGYEWIDSDEPGGPVYSWVDISTRGTPITGLGDESNVGPFAIGFNFNFYGNTYNSFRFCSNGFMSFTSTSTVYTNTQLPTNGAEPLNVLAPLWDDLTFATSGQAYYYSNNTDSLVVSWVSVPHWSSGGPYTFQVIMLRNGKIFFQYQTLGSPVNSCTIGIQNSNGAIGLQVVYNAAYLHNNMAIKFSSEEWLSVEPSGGAIEPLSSDTVQAIFDSTDLPEDSIYTGLIRVASNDPDAPTITIPATLGVGTFGPSCDYVVGDVNNSHVANGADVTYTVNYLRGWRLPPYSCDCPPHGLFYPAGDVNGDCAFNGLDVTFMVNYYKGGPDMHPCPDCPPIHGIAVGRGGEQPAAPVLKPKSRPEVKTAE